MFMSREQKEHRKEIDAQIQGLEAQQFISYSITNKIVFNLYNHCC